MELQEDQIINENHISHILEIPVPQPALSKLETMPQQLLLDKVHPSRISKLTKANCQQQKPAEDWSHNRYNGPNSTKPCKQTLYISSSMFRNLDAKRLSSKDQWATKLFYPGADSA